MPIHWLFLITAFLASSPAYSVEDPAFAALREKSSRDPLLSGVNRDEALVESLRAEILAPWEKSWLSGDAESFARLFVQEGRDLDWSSSPSKPRRSRDGVREFSWNLKSVPAGARQARLYLKGFQSIDDFRLDAAKITPQEGSARLEVLFDLRGRTARGGRRQDRGRLALELKRSGERWLVMKVEAREMERLESRGTVFEDATEAFGLASVPVVDRREAIRRGGYALSVADYDGDTRPDMMVGSWGPLRLLRGTGKRFEDVTEKAGLAAESLVKAAAFADLDNDGDKDIFLLRFTDTSLSDDAVAYRNKGDGTFERVTGLLPRSRKYDQAMPMALADFDLDGSLDLYLGFPGSRDFTNFGREANVKAPQGVWLNRGAWTFEEAPHDSPMWLEPDPVYPHSVVAADINGDRKPDLLVSEDRGNISPLYRNEGGGRFRNVTRGSGIVNWSWGMTAVTGDYDGDGHTDLALTNIDFLAARRILESRAGRESSAEEKQALEKVRANMPGNRLFHNKGDGTFEETTDSAGIRWAGEGPAGGAWVDYNSDGWLDLYVSNGLWSGGSSDISSLFSRLHLAREAAYAYDAVESALGPPVARHSEGVGQNEMLRILRADPSLSMAGYSRNRLFRNNGDGTFTELGYLAGADRIEDGYVAAAADVDADGRQDLVLRNGDPAPGRKFLSVILLRNMSERSGSLAVTLEGSRSNRDGVGARLELEVAGRRLVRETQSVTGTSQSEPGAFFGLGGALKAERLVVRWPSGLKEEFKDLKPGRIHIIEGQSGRTAGLGSR